jgi:hypothetical protein
MVLFSNTECAEHSKENYPAIGVLQNGSIFQYRMHKHSKENYPAIGVLSLQTPESGARTALAGEMDGTELPAVQNSWFTPFGQD